MLAGRLGAAAVFLALAALSVVSPATGSDRADRPGKPDDTVRTALEAGLQTAPKRAQRGYDVVNGVKGAAPNPYLALVPDPTAVDWSYWRHRLALGSAARAEAEQRSARPFVHNEREPAGVRGRNDRQRKAELLRGFGTGDRQHGAVRVLGAVSQPVIQLRSLTTAENNGSIPLATETGIAGTGGVAVSSTIGDGPHGSAARDPDPDFFRVEAPAGKTITVDTRGSAVDTVVVVYNAEGTLLAADDDSGGSLTSLLRYTATRTTEYFVMVAGYSNLPADPFDSASGDGADEEGGYELALTVGDVDRDYYAVRLRAGDVLGGTITGASEDVVVHRYDRVQVVGSEVDLSFIYPGASPLPGGGNATFAYVAEETGLYAVSTENGDGSYRLGLNVYRPAGAAGADAATQTIFLDFDGARIDSDIWGAPGRHTLSPLRAFLADWDLRAGAKNPLIDQVVATVTENLRRDLRRRGLNDDFSIEIRNSRDDPDRFGRPNVSRVVIGGTIEEFGIATIGIAQSIDPGNYEPAESAVVLLDTLSAPAAEFGDPSLNSYLRPRSAKVKFIGTAVGILASHEAGHLIGSFHVDQFNRGRNIMDQGGNFPVLFGVGADSIGGTADDRDVDFGEDRYNPFEGFTGIEDTLNNSAWGSFTTAG